MDNTPAYPLVLVESLNIDDNDQIYSTQYNTNIVANGPTGNF